MQLFNNIKRFFKPRKSRVDIIFCERNEVPITVKEFNDSSEFRDVIVTSVSASREYSTGKPTYIIAISYTYS